MLWREWLPTIRYAVLLAVPAIALGTWFWVGVVG